MALRRFLRLGLPSFHESLVSQTKQSHVIQGVLSQNCIAFKVLPQNYYCQERGKFVPTFGLASVLLYKGEAVVHQLSRNTLRVNLATPLLIESALGFCTTARDEQGKVWSVGKDQHPGELFATQQDAIAEIEYLSNKIS